MYWRLWIGIGGIFGFLSVAFGAFAAHSLKGRLSDQELTWFQTASHYQLSHSLALVVVGLLGTKIDSTAVTLAGICFSVGIMLFSGSLYGMALGLPRWLGMVTPMGGVGMLIAWLALVYAVMFP